MKERDWAVFCALADVLRDVKETVKVVASGSRPGNVAEVPAHQALRKADFLEENGSERVVFEEICECGTQTTECEWFHWREP